MSIFVMCGGNEFSSICSKKREYVKGNSCCWPFKADNKKLSIAMENAVNLIVIYALPFYH